MRRVSFKCLKKVRSTAEATHVPMGPSYGHRLDSETPVAVIGTWSRYRVMTKGSWLQRFGLHVPQVRW